MFQNLMNLAGLLKQAQQMSGKMQAQQESLRRVRGVGVAGEGLVAVEANGLGEVTEVRIDPALIAQNDVIELQDLTLLAVNQALEKAKQQHQESLKSLAQGLNVPGLSEALAKLGGNG